MAPLRWTQRLSFLPSTWCSRSWRCCGPHRRPSPAQVPRALSEHFDERLPAPVRDALAVGPGVVGGAGHGCQISPAPRAISPAHRQAGGREARCHSFWVLALSHCFEVIVADLIAETPRARVNQEQYLPDIAHAEDLGDAGIVNLIHHLNFEEMVAGAERPRLRQPPCLRLSLTLSGSAPSMQPCSSVTPGLPSVPNPTSTAQAATLSSAAFSISLPPEP